MAVWDGFSILPIRYVEFLISLNYTSYYDFIIIVVVGKTLGSVITYKVSNYIISRDELERIMISSTNSFYFRALEVLVRDHPYLMAITIKLFFPSILASIGLAMLLPPQSGL